MSRCAATVWTRSTNGLHTARRQCSRNAVFGEWCRQHSDGSFSRWDEGAAKLAELERLGRNPEVLAEQDNARRKEEQLALARFRIGQRQERKRWKLLRHGSVRP